MAAARSLLAGIGVAVRGDKIAILGDLHGKWNHLDERFFDEAGFDLLIFVGDLATGTSADLKMVSSLARLRTRSLIMPGNNDAQLLAELNDVIAAKSPGPAPRATVCGYSNHTIETTRGEVTIVAARPCGLGGSEFSFGRQIEKRFGITGLEHSAGRQ